MGLEIESLARGVGGDQDAQGMPGRRLIEGSLDCLALVWWGGSVEHLDTVLGQGCPCDCAAQHVQQIALGVFVLGEDEQPQIGPGGVQIE